MTDNNGQLGHNNKNKNIVIHTEKEESDWYFYGENGGKNLLEAICVQHEIDHLDGKLFIDYVPDVKLQRLRKKIAKSKKNQPTTEGTTVRVV